MQIIVKKNLTALLLFGATLVSCTTADEKYQNTEMLERPPTLIVDKQSQSPNVIEENAQAEARQGLGDKVSITEADPLRLTIKQSFDQAWNTIASALKQQELEITDRNRDEGLYYITYDPDSYQPEDAGLFDVSLLKGDYAEEGYVLKLQGQGSETEITAEVVKKPSTRSDDDDVAPADGAEKLLKALYKTLRDDLKEE